jgi:hypothetical protein
VHIEEQERKLILIALQVTNTYCHLAETHLCFLHRASALRAVERAEREIAMVEQRLDKNKTLFDNQNKSVTTQIAAFKRRIQSLNLAA